MKPYRLSQIAGAVVLGLGLSTAAFAQDTASSISGKILGPEGNPAANTKIVITHVPSGTTKVVTTNETGSYNAKGLRAGGPYQVIIDSDKFQDQNLNDIYLEVGKPYRLRATLDKESIETIVVTGSAMHGYTNSGTSGSWGAEEIIKSAGGNRDLKDVLRNNPLAVTGTTSDAPLSIAGMNPRYNSFNVDGVRQNDDFGLNSNGYPTQRSPISIDAVEQVSLNAAPFSARHGGFSGGQINAVTKSGANETFGSLFYEKSQDSWAGTPKDPWDGSDVDLEFDEKIFGGTLGGAIIEDKLFYFLSYDKFEAPTQLEFGPAGSGAPNETFATLEDYNRVREIAERVYGVDAGVWDAQPEEEDEKILAKIDWNINDDHRLSFTYQNTEGNITRGMTSRESELKLNTHWYNNNQKLESYAAHFYSDWTSNFSSEIKVAYKEVETEAQPATKGFGDVTVFTDEYRGDPASPIAFGPDRYRHANRLSNDTLAIRAQGEYLYGDHEITFGVDYEMIDIFNLFAPDSLGRWEFDSIEDFENGDASFFEYYNAYTNVAEDAAAEFDFSNIVFFVEDAYYLTDTLLVTAGIRYERISMSDAPAHNENFEARYGFSNSTNLDGADIILPRVSFVWDAAEDLEVKGGVGRFSGGRPNVWLSNAFSNDGITYVRWDKSDINPDNVYKNVDITTVHPDVLASMSAGDGNTNVTDPDFDLPSDWRFQLGFTYNFAVPHLGDNWSWTGEYMRIERENDVLWQDLARTPKLDENGDVVTTADGGRIIYEVVDPITGEPSDRYDLMLTNADDDGRSNIFTTSISSAFDNGLSFNFSYTNQDITEGTPGTSSTATSNYQYPVTLDRQEAYIGTADYEIEHRLALNIDYTTEFIDGYATSFNLFFERRSGRPFSYVMGAYNDSDLGDQTAFNRSSAYVPYIPTGADDPNVVLNGITWDQLSEWIDVAGLAGYAGGYAPKNNATSPWLNRMDLNITQEVPGLMDGHKGAVYFTIQNVLNLIDSSKGQVTRKEFPSTKLVDYDIDDQGRYVYSEAFRGFDDSNWDTFDPKASTYNIKIGVRYTF